MSPSFAVYRFNQSVRSHFAAVLVEIQFPCGFVPLSKHTAWSSNQSLKTNKYLEELT